MLIYRSSVDKFLSFRWCKAVCLFTLADDVATGLPCRLVETMFDDVSRRINRNKLFTSFFLRLSRERDMLDFFFSRILFSFGVARIYVEELWGRIEHRLIGHNRIDFRVAGDELIIIIIDSKLFN